MYLLKEKESRESIDAYAVSNNLVFSSIKFSNSTRRIESG